MWLWSLQRGKMLDRITPKGKKGFVQGAGMGSLNLALAIAPVLYGLVEEKVGISICMWLAAGAIVLACILNLSLMHHPRLLRVTSSNADDTPADADVDSKEDCLLDDTGKTEEETRRSSPAARLGDDDSAAITGCQDAGERRENNFRLLDQMEAAAKLTPPSLEDLDQRKSSSVDNVITYPNIMAKNYTKPTIGEEGSDDNEDGPLSF